MIYIRTLEVQSIYVTEKSESMIILNQRSIEFFLQVITRIICSGFVDTSSGTVSELMIFDIKAPKLLIF